MSALQQGFIDAAEWVGPWVDISFGFQKIAKYFYGPGIHEPGTTNEFIFNRDSWNLLSIDLQEIITNVCHSSYIDGLSEFLFYNSQSFKNIESKYNVFIGHFPKEVIRKMLHVSKDIVEEFSELGDIHKRIYESWKENLTNFNNYQTYSDYGFIKQRIELGSS